MEIVTVTKNNFNLFKNFFLTDFNSFKENITFGVLLNKSTPCAVISASFCETKDKLTIENFYVLKKFRNIGLGNSLLEKLKTTATKIGIKKLYLKLVTTKTNAKLLEDFLSKRNFKDFKILCKIYKKNSKSILKESSFTKYILQKNVTLPENLKILKFKDITKELKNKILAEKNVTYPENLSPFSNEHNLKDAHSLFVLDCFKNNLLAWLTALDAPGNSILYRSFFVKNECRKTNVGKFLLKSAIKKHQTDFYEKYVLFAVSSKNIKVDKALPKYFTMEEKNIYYEIAMEQE